MSVRQKGKFELLKSNIVTIYMFIFDAAKGEIIRAETCEMLKLQ